MVAGRSADAVGVEKTTGFDLSLLWGANGRRANPTAAVDLSSAGHRSCAHVSGIGNWVTAPFGSLNRGTRLSANAPERQALAVF